MKTRFRILVICICSLLYVNISAQQISMTIDNQTPGWLSSKINYGDQQTLENLKVTGYINGSDIKFIRLLNTDCSLNGVIDLSEVNVVKGGDAYEYISWSTKGTTTTENNKITYGMFSGLDSIQKLILPYSIDSIFETDGTNPFLGTKIDTLIMNCNIKSTNYCFKTYSNWCTWIKYLELPPSIEVLNLEGFLNPSYTNIEEFNLPKNLKKITYGNYYACRGFSKIVSYVLEPSGVENLSFLNKTGSSNIQPGVLYVPVGTKEAYAKILWNYAIIEKQYYADSISISGKTDAILEGDSILLSVMYSPDSTQLKGVHWHSADNSIAKVDKNGMVYGIEEGETMITAKYAEDTTKVATFKVVVNPIKVSSIILDKTQIVATVGDNIQLVAALFPENAKNKTVAWYSSDESVAIVSFSGLVQVLKPGTAVIIATTTDGTGLSARCTIDAIAGIEGVEVDNNKMEVARYDIHGRKLNEPAKGINIVKMSDGSTRKEIVK